MLHYYYYYYGLLTDDALCERGPLKGGQAQISYLDGARGARYEDVVTLEVSVDNWRGPGVEEVEALQYLSAPAPQHLGLHDLKAL